jgi:uncharacterized protein DUF2752
MVPGPVSVTDRERMIPAVRPILTRWVRAALVLIALLLVGLFWLAITIDPYDADGQPLTMGTHRQLGLPVCGFVRMTGLPCPSCGMTTSFALLMHGDPVASLRANAVGTLFALFLLALVPWNLVSAARGRWLWVRSIEPWLLGAVIAFIGLAAIRWGIVLGVYWLNK